MTLKNFIILLTAGSLFACETVIDLDLPPEPTRLVVNSLINPDSLITMRLSRSKSVLDQAEFFTVVRDARVTLYEDGREVARLNDQGEGRYRADFRPSIGRQYTVEAAAEGLPPVEARSSIQAPIAIEDVSVGKTRVETGSTCINGDCQPTYSDEYQLGLRLSDPLNQVNYYEIVAYAVVQDSFPNYDDLGNFIGYDSTQWETQVYLQTDDPVVDNPYSDLEGGGFYGESLLLSDELFSGQSYTVAFTTDTYFGEVKELTVQLRTLSEDQYQYLRTRHLQEYNASNPLSEVVPVYTNVENGFGIFAGYSTSSIEVDTD